MFEYTSMGLPSHLLRSLSDVLRKTGDGRSAQQIVELAVTQWIVNAGVGSAAAQASICGYQWKSLFLPEGTKLRMQYHGNYSYAQVVRDAIVFEGVALSPRQFAMR